METEDEEHPVRIAIAQLNSTPDPSENLRLVESWTDRAAQAGADLVVFPEATMRCFGHDLSEVAEPLDGPWANRVREIAKAFSITIAVGMFTPADVGRVHNTLLVTGPNVDTGYDKIHLYDAFGFRESDTVAAGDRPVVADIAGTRVGLATCYDIRFPALFTRLARDGAEVVLVCASWGAGPGKVEQWELLTRARALDATVFVAACGQAEPRRGTAQDTSTAPTGVGHSAIVSPWGTPVASLGSRSDLLVTELELEEAERARNTIAVLDNARF